VAAEGGFFGLCLMGWRRLGLPWEPARESTNFSANFSANAGEQRGLANLGVEHFLGCWTPKNGNFLGSFMNPPRKCLYSLAGLFNLQEIYISLAVF
jgi:hypothetical protein